MTYLEFYMQKHPDDDPEQVVKALCPDCALWGAIPFWIRCPDGPVGLIACTECWKRDITDGGIMHDTGGD